MREGDGKMHGSPHDDRVIALAIANQMVKHAYSPQYRPRKRKPGPGTLGRLLEHAFRHENEAKQRDYIGKHAVRKAA